MMGWLPSHLSWALVSTLSSIVALCALFSTESEICQRQQSERERSPLRSPAHRRHTPSSVHTLQRPTGRSRANSWTPERRSHSCWPTDCRNSGSAELSTKSPTDAGMRAARSWRAVGAWLVATCGESRAERAERRLRECLHWWRGLWSPRESSEGIGSDRWRRTTRAAHWLSWDTFRGADIGFWPIAWRRRRAAVRGFAANRRSGSDKRTNSQRAESRTTAERTQPSSEWLPERDFRSAAHWTSWRTTRAKDNCFHPRIGDNSEDICSRESALGTFWPNGGPPPRCLCSHAFGRCRSGGGTRGMHAAPHLATGRPPLPSPPSSWRTSLWRLATRRPERVDGPESWVDARECPPRSECPPSPRRRADDRTLSADCRPHSRRRPPLWRSAQWAHRRRCPAKWSHCWRPDCRPDWFPSCGNTRDVVSAQHSSLLIHWSIVCHRRQPLQSATSPIESTWRFSSIYRDKSLRSSFQSICAQKWRPSLMWRTEDRDCRFGTESEDSFCPKRSSRLISSKSRGKTRRRRKRRETRETNDFFWNYSKICFSFNCFSN